MKIALLWVGKTTSAPLSGLIEEYISRVKRQSAFEVWEIPDVKHAKSLSEAELKQREGERILERIHASDCLILLDEHGQTPSSPQFAQFLESKRQGNAKQLVFCIGGAYGFSDAVYARANDLLSLSRMTFTHQMIRLLFAEQLYRAHAISAGLPYHHS